MKKLLFLFLILLGSISYSQDNIESSKTLNNDKKIKILPLNAQRYILQKYPNDSILKAGYRRNLWTKTYEVHYDLWVIEFDDDGVWIKNYTPDGIATLDNLPEPIKQTVKKTYPKQKIIKLEQNENNLYIFLDNNKSLSFKNKL
jgi:hypothetical protein